MRFAFGPNEVGMDAGDGVEASQLGVALNAGATLCTAGVPAARQHSGSH